MKMLLLDACGEGSRVALSARDELIEQLELARGAGSAEIVNAIAGLLDARGWTLRDLSAVGVVSGPGSFTGVRVGMATAKGLCEGARLSMIAVSRLMVLADAVKLKKGNVALDAGRGELYLGQRSVDGGWQEWLGGVADVVSQKGHGEVWVAEARVAEMLAEVRPKVHEMDMHDVLRTVLNAMEAGATDMVLVDANYVRREGDIYKKAAVQR